MKVKYESISCERVIADKLELKAEKTDIDYFDLYLFRATVFKQWGFEYPLCFNPMRGAAWMMHMYANHKSSFHCHSKKISIILILEGSCLVETKGHNPRMFYEGDIAIFDKKVFHSEGAGPKGCKILQLESSCDKTDALRLSDDFGKVGLPYEGKCKVVYLNE